MRWCMYTRATAPLLMCYLVAYAVLYACVTAPLGTCSLVAYAVMYARATAPLLACFLVAYAVMYNTHATVPLLTCSLVAYEVMAHNRAFFLLMIGWWWIIYGIWKFFCIPTWMEHCYLRCGWYITGMNVWYESAVFEACIHIVTITANWRIDEIY